MLLLNIRQSKEIKQQFYLVGTAKEIDKYIFYFSPYTKPHFHPGLQRLGPPFSSSSNTVASYIKPKLLEPFAN